MKFKLDQPCDIFLVGQRDNQEDFIWPVSGSATTQDRLFIVCDGMGGHEHGEVASSTFAQGLAEYFTKHVTCDDVVTDDMLKAAIAHAYLLLDAKDDGNYRRMGTTLTLLSFHKGGVMAAHIGDSRIYHLRPGKGLLYVSRDHSLVFDLYRSGEISYDEIKTSPNKNVITRAVQPGEDRRTRADIVHITDVRAGDYFYLCSDGMLEQMEDAELYELLAAPGSDEKKIAQLIKATEANRDNHSAYLIKVNEVIGEIGDPDDGGEEERTTIYNALNMKPIKEEPQPSSNLVEQSLPDEIEPQDSPCEVVPSHALPMDPMDPMARPRRTSCLAPWMFLIVLLLLAAAGALLWNLKKKTNKPKQKVDTTLLHQVAPRPIDPSLIPTSPDDNDKSDEVVVNQKEKEKENVQVKVSKPSTDKAPVGHPDLNVRKIVPDVDKKKEPANVEQPGGDVHTPTRTPVAPPVTDDNSKTTPDLRDA